MKQPVPTAAAVHWSSFADLTPTRLYALLRLRVDVFVVEQECAYPDLDGRDTEPSSWHGWIELDGAVVAALRVLQDADAMAIGRVVTHADHRGQGYAARLVAAALTQIGPGRVRLGAQAHLEGWYARLGFVRSGPDYVEDGIAHLPMVRQRVSPST